MIAASASLKPRTARRPCHQWGIEDVPPNGRVEGQGFRFSTMVPSAGVEGSPVGRAEPMAGRRVSDAPSPPGHGTPSYTHFPGRFRRYALPFCGFHPLTRQGVGKTPAGCGTRCQSAFCKAEDPAGRLTRPTSGRYPPAAERVCRGSRSMENPTLSAKRRQFIRETEEDLNRLLSPPDRRIGWLLAPPGAFRRRKTEPVTGGGVGRGQVGHERP
jgi:hypothetical protein